MKFFMLQEEWYLWIWGSLLSIKVICKVSMVIQNWFIVHPQVSKNCVKGELRREGVTPTSEIRKTSKIVSCLSSFNLKDYNRGPDSIVGFYCCTISRLIARFRASSFSLCSHVKPWTFFLHRLYCNLPFSSLQTDDRACRSSSLTFIRTSLDKKIVSGTAKEKKAWILVWH